MHGYLGPYTSYQSNMSLTPCDYIYVLEVKFSRREPRTSTTTVYASDGGNHRLAFQSNLVIATNVILMSLSVGDRLKFLDAVHFLYEKDNTMGCTIPIHR
jgi:hypothetical protein